VAFLTSLFFKSQTGLNVVFYVDAGLIKSYLLHICWVLREDFMKQNRKKIGRNLKHLNIHSHFPTLSPSAIH
jgi:hypothetical protein